MSIIEDMIKFKCVNLECDQKNKFKCQKDII